MVLSDSVEFVSVLTVLPDTDLSPTSCMGVSTSPVGSVLSANRRWISSVLVLIQVSCVVSAPSVGCASTVISSGMVPEVSVEGGDCGVLFGACTGSVELMCIL